MTYKKAFEDNVVNFKVLNEKTWDVVEFSHLANKIYVTADEMMMGDSIFEKVVLDNISWTIIKDESTSKIRFITSFDDRYFIRLYFEASQENVMKFALKRIENEFTLGYIAKYDDIKIDLKRLMVSDKDYYLNELYKIQKNGDKAFKILEICLEKNGFKDALNEFKKMKANVF